MNIAVCVKQTPDTTTRVKIADDGKSIATDGITWIINPYDEFAIEEALQLVEKHGGEVTIISMGPASIEKTMREALAMGAHKAIRIDAPAAPDDPVVTARALMDVLKAGSYDLIFLGRQAIDDDHHQMASLVAQGLDLPCATVVIKLEVSGEQIIADREIEGGHETVKLSLPAVIGANRHLNTPRYRSLKGIMQAKKKQIEVATPAPAAAKLIVEKLAYPPEKQEGKLYTTGAEAADEVVRLLREEAKVI